MSSYKSIHLSSVVDTCSDPGTPFYGHQNVKSYELGQIVRYNCTQPGFTPDYEAIICLQDTVKQKLGWFVFNLDSQTTGPAVDTSNSGVRPACRGESSVAVCLRRIM